VTHPIPQRRSRIEAADEMFGVSDLPGYLGYLEANKDRLGVRDVPRPIGDHPKESPVVAYARVDHARWLADCPWGCGAAHALPRAERRFWCTACAGGGLGKTCRIVWPEHVARIEVNMESLPTALANWPCFDDIPKLAAGAPMCGPCTIIAGGDAPRGDRS
jgi:hypothetical protein